LRKIKIIFGRDFIVKEVYESPELYVVDFSCEESITVSAMGFGDNDMKDIWD
jgi:hypothetical protein